MEEHCPACELRVNGGRTASGYIHAQFLGDLLQRWQALFAAIAQAAAGRPTTRGVIPSDILEQTALLVTAFAEGSFVTRLLAGPSNQLELPVAQSLALRAFDDFQRLSSASSNRHQISLLMHRMKGRVLSSYARLLQLVDTWDSTLTVSMADPLSTEVRHACMSPATARAILPILSEVGSPEESNRVAVIGILNAAHRRTGTFEVDLGDEGTISGRVVDSAALEGVVIGRRYELVLAEVITKDPITSNVESSWSLIGHPRDLSVAVRPQADLSPNPVRTPPG